MRILLDNNLPPSLARALNELSSTVDHQVIHLSERFDRNCPDIEWIQALSQERDWVVVSQDHFKKGDLEKKAFREAKVTIFCLAKPWSKARYWDKAAHLVRWWPAILHQAEAVSPGAAFSVPLRHGPNARFKQIKL